LNRMWGLPLRTTPVVVNRTNIYYPYRSGTVVTALSSLVCAFDWFSILSPGSRSTVLVSFQLPFLVSKKMILEEMKTYSRNCGNLVTEKAELEYYCITVCQ
jgi:hypothetical protein